MDGWAFVDIKLQTKGGWAMQGCVMQGHRNMAGGSHTIPWNGASPLWSWRLLVHKSQAILLALQSPPAIGRFCDQRSKAWVISRMATDTATHRPAKSFLTSCAEK